MPVSVRELVLAAVQARLSSIPGVAVWRNRRAPIEVFPAVLMAEEGHEVAETLTGATLYRQHIRIDCAVVATDDAAAGPALSDLVAKVQSALLADPSLGGLAFGIEEEATADPDLDREPGHGPHMALGLRFAVTFLTKPGDPYSVGP
jgi:hypothetical protein